jgi:CRP-like cAMP-binding protein
MADNCGNLLLDSLPAITRRAFLEPAEKVDLRLGEQIITQGDRARYAFFPTSAVCSLLMGLKSGDKAECATVGAEGMIGVSLVATAPPSGFSAIVQIAGAGYRLPLPTVSELVQHHRPLCDALLVYAGFALNAVGRSVACNSYHSIVERLARWLLILHDRVERDELALTHDMLSQMLAATRPRVSLAAGKLRSLHTIDYQRGVLRILDRKRLEQVACECYEATRRNRQMLPWVQR